MAGDGPTTAGSIVGKLKMDRSDWLAGVAATSADIKALDSMDPTIDVHSNAKDVVGALDSAARATKSLGDASDRTSGRMSGFNDNLNRSRSRLATIATAVGILVPLLAPVGAAAVGVGGAFLGMGAAGVFALMGIIREMKEGSALGKQYEQGVNSLKTAFNQLSSTSAAAMLQSFNRVVSETNAALPMLNQQIGAFAAVLGRSGANVVSGLISSFQVLNPLFMTAAQWVEELTAGFATWAASGGMEDFASYAMAALPQVVDLLGALGTMVLHVLEALAPLGAIGVAVLSGIADAVSGIPVETLSTLIGMITWGAVAFKTWAFIAPMLVGIRSAWLMLTGAMTVSTGAIGWVVAGVAALASILALATTNTESLTAATARWTNVIKNAKDAADLFNSANATKSWAQPFDEATLSAENFQEKLDKIAHNDFARGLDTQANIMKAALKEIGAELGNVANTDLPAAQNSFRMLADEMELNKSQQLDLLNAMPAYKDALLEQASALGVNVTTGSEAANSANLLAIANGELGGSQEGLAGTTAGATSALQTQKDTADALRDALDLLNGRTLDAEGAQNQFESALVNAKSYVDEMTGAVDTAGASLDGMTESAVSNRGELINQVEMAQVAAEKYAAQGHSAEETGNKLDTMKQQIIENAVANGMNRDQVTSYINELFRIPARLNPTEISANTGIALSQVNAMIANINARVATITVRAVMPDLNGAASGSGRMGVPGANGLTARGMAGGGSVVGPGTAHSDGAGLFVLAHGEEVISNRFGQADRWRADLKRINNGQQPAGYARSMAGPDAGAPQVSDRPIEVKVYVTTMQGSDPQELERQVGRGVRDALRGLKT